MLKHKKIDYIMISGKNVIILAFVLTCLLSQVIFCMISRSSSYSFFIELSNSSGIQAGTSVRMRGMHIGSIKSVKLKLNCVLVIVSIDSDKILIPTFSIIETAQTGLLNDSVIDIIPYNNLSLQGSKLQSPLSKSCNSSVIICNKMYVVADRGLNYDDLVRSATRISQRFDDPRFFNIFYLFLRSSVEITELIAELLTSMTSNPSMSIFNTASDDFF